MIDTGRCWICVASIALTIGCTEAKTEVSKAPSRYLYVWAGMGHDSTPGIDMMTVLDANPASKGYGSVVAAVTVDSGGLMPHHTEFELPANGPLFANDYDGNTSFRCGDFQTSSSWKRCLFPRSREILPTCIRLKCAHWMIVRFS